MSSPPLPPSSPSPPPTSSPPYTPPPDLKPRLAASYDAIAPTYNTWTIPHSTIRLHYLDQLLSRLPTDPPSSSSPPLSILELGCGCGLPVTQKLLSHPSHFSITANDLSSAQLALARANLHPVDPPDRLTLLEGDMSTLLFPPQSFTAIIALYSLIHLPRPEQSSMLTKISQWLTPGGYLLANFSAEETEGSVVEKWLGEEKGWMFWSGWGVGGTVERVRREGGLEVVVQREEGMEEGGGARFLWVLARKGEEGGE